jgi:hypothetical protein
MIQRILHARRLLACLLSAVTGMALYFRAPFPEDNIFLRVMAIRSASAFISFKYFYTLFLYTTPHITYSILFFGIYIFALPAGRKIRAGKLPLYPNPRKRAELSLVVGEAHHARNQIPSETPRQLVIPERGPFTGIAIVGAVGSGKTASCMYPFAEQILAHRDKDYCGADKDDPIYYAQHTVMKAQAELQRQSNDEKAGEDQRTTTKEIALDH